MLLPILYSSKPSAKLLCSCYLHFAFSQERLTYKFQHSTETRAISRSPGKETREWWKREPAPDSTECISTTENTRGIWQLLTTLTVTMETLGITVEVRNINFSIKFLQWTLFIFHIFKIEVLPLEEGFKYRLILSLLPLLVSIIIIL